MEFRKRGIIYFIKMFLNVEQVFIRDLKSLSGIFFLFLKNKKNVKVVFLWFYNIKFEVRKVCLRVNLFGKIDC